LRRLRIAPPVQLRLVPLVAPRRSEVWAGMPEATQGQVLALLARLIARGVVDADCRHRGGLVSELSKITPAHRQRLAYVYVRQSSAAQVRVNTDKP